MDNKYSKIFQNLLTKKEQCATTFHLKKMCVCVCVCV